MSYLIIGGTNVAVGQMPGGTNVGGTYVCGTFVCGTKVAPPYKRPFNQLTTHLVHSWIKAHNNIKVYNQTSV